MSEITILVLIIIQIISLIWGGFFSDLSSTGPIWIWAYLLIITPIGIWIGYKWRRKKHFTTTINNGITKFTTIRTQTVVFLKKDANQLLNNENY